MYHTVEENFGVWANYAPPEFTDEQDDLAWKAVEKGLFKLKKGVVRSFCCDPSKSALYSEFPVLLGWACEAAMAIAYHPMDRTFIVPNLNCPYDWAGQVLSHDPFSGKILPPRLNEQWDALIAAIGLEDPYSEDWDRVPDEFKSEAWWIARGL